MSAWYTDPDAWSRVVVGTGLLVLGLFQPASRDLVPPKPWAFPRITVAELQAWETAGTPPFILVDVRAKEAYDREHIEGAISIPWGDLPKRHGELRKDWEIVTYCTCPTEHSSGGAASELHDKFGFTKLHALKGGMYAWQDAGLPTTKASDRLAMLGPSLYAQHCSTCHQPGGEGLAGVVPPLSGSALLKLAQARPMVGVLLQGLNTGSHQNQMPAFYRLRDEEVAAIASHLRKKWGQGPGAQAEVKASEVALVRAELGVSAPASPTPEPSHAHPH